jgi:hypothetical protein
MSILVLTSDTLIGTPATGNLEYNGQFYGTDSALSRAQMQRITQGTAVSYTSFTTTTYNDFLNIPAWVKRVSILFKGVSISGTSQFLIQLGSGSIQNTGYTGGGTRIGAASVGAAAYTTGFGFSNTTAATVYSGTTTLTSFGSNIWVAAGVLGGNATEFNGITGGDVTLSGALDRVRITTVNGTDTFDAGSINILYEG